MTDATDDDKALLLSDLSSIKNLLENPLHNDNDNIPTLHEVVTEPSAEPLQLDKPQFTPLFPRTATEKLFSENNPVNPQQQLGFVEQQALDSSQRLVKQKLEHYAQDLRKELLARYMPLLEEEFQQRMAQHLDKLIKQLT